MSTPKILKEMAQFTAVTGQINEIQERNLKMFPLIFFNDIVEAKVDYNLSPISVGDSETSLNYSRGYVKYFLQLGKDSTDLDKRFIALQKSVRTLFWEDLDVELYLNGKKYEGT